MYPYLSGQSYNPSSSNFKSILDAALSNYKEITGNELLDHPLAAEVQKCDSVDAMLTILQGQARAFKQSSTVEQGLLKRIIPVVKIVSAFSDTLGTVAGTVRSQDQMRDSRCIPTLLCRRSPLQGSSLLRFVFYLRSVFSLPRFVELSYLGRFIEGNGCDCEP